MDTEFQSHKNQYRGIVLKCVGGLYTCLACSPASGGEAGQASFYGPARTGRLTGAPECPAGETAYPAAGPEGYTVACTARGVFRQQDVAPMAGDRVVFSDAGDGGGRIEEVLPRRNALVRPPVANLDALVIVASIADPSPSTLVIDKMTVVAEQAAAEPLIVVNKADLSDASGLEDLYRRAGFDTFAVSAKTGEGIAALKDRLAGLICVFAGNSGVGKSSVLNALDPDFALETGSVSKKLGRGRHTTRVAELFPRGDGGFWVDTPGFSSLDMARVLPIEAGELAGLFREFRETAARCRFRDCLHMKEAGCAVTAAAEAGDIDPRRYRSYAAILAELEAGRAW